ncbi:PREDICTED: tumor protein D52-like isoform X15 [Branchiostoma belcheri]|uniref:Tumor protein D52-like isoform X15 n=1 Tax=Branchiostoma belcheri TaxID=7741 RepID=A0A6P5A5S1_BRABE|nr:PREDICTED: tumor protein D52-like isoform X15 [Branchiostoma belcheri]
MEAYEEDSFHIETLEISDASLDFGHGELLLKDQSPKRTNKKSLVKKTPPRQQEKKFFTRRISDLREKDGGKVASGQSTPEDEYASPFDFSTKAVYENYLFLMPDNPHSHGDEIQLCDDDDGQKLQSYSQKLPDEHTYDNRDSAYSTPDPTQDGDPLYQDPTELQDEQEKEEIRAELQKTEEEIKTLKQVLASKERAAADLKRRLGITPLKEFKDEASKTWKNVQSSQAYKKTSETLSVAGQKTAQASAAAWQSMSRKLGEMKNSQSFKSFEEKVGSTVSNLKSTTMGYMYGPNFTYVRK